LAPYLLLAQIEAALETKQYSRMNKLLLRDDIGFPLLARTILEIRQADYWFAIKQPVKAYVAYNNSSKTKILFTQPYSLNGYCASLYGQKKYSESAECYQKLAALSLNKKSIGLARYRENMAKLKYLGGESYTYNFTQIENGFSGSEAGMRAKLKKIDLILLKDESQYDWAIQQYKVIAQNSISRSIRVEALFKQALLYSFLSSTDKSIKILQKLLRDFRKTQLKPTIQSLLIALLPGEINHLVSEHKYLDALVLAKQNNELFQKKWISTKYLVDIAEAYIVSIDMREQFYLPLIRAAFANGNYSLVDDYASQYTYFFPNGESSQDILFFRIQAFYADGKLSEAIRLIPSPLPEHTGIVKLAASLFFRTDNFLDCVDTFNTLLDLNYDLNPMEKIMYAESLYRTGSVSQAKKMFSEIDTDSPFYNQSLYREAELERKEGNQKNSLNILRKIVETGKNDRWQQYAEKELRFAKFKDIQ